METKESAPIRVLQNTRSYSSKYGQMYVHSIEFENGDKGDYNSKSEDCSKFKEGETVKYTIEKKQNGKYENVIIKPFSENQGGYSVGGRKSTGSNASFAMSYAKDLVVAGVVDVKKLLDSADKIYNWLESKK